MKATKAVTAGLVPELTDVPETMLWSLHHRASEAQFSDAVLIDPDSVRIHAALDYDFAARFGEPAGSLAVRAAEIDRVLRQWIACHRDGCVVSLGEGLETQVRRVDNGRYDGDEMYLKRGHQLRQHAVVVIKCRSSRPLSAP